MAAMTNDFAVAEPFLQYSSVLATGSTISLNRLPVKLPNGTVIYKDIAIQLQNDAAGLVSVVVPITQVVSPALLSANFKAGIYVAPANPKYGFAMSGPGVVPGSSVSKWEVNITPTKLAAGNSCGVPAIFYVGALARNPNYASRLQPAGITSVEYSYGLMGSPAVSCTPLWAPGSIVGFSQSNDMLIIAKFTDAAGVDHNVPVETRTYRLEPPAP